MLRPSNTYTFYYSELICSEFYFVANIFYHVVMDISIFLKMTTQSSETGPLLS